MKPQSLFVPESIEDDWTLVKLISGVEELSGNDWSVTKGGGLAANLLAVQHDVFSMSSKAEQESSWSELSNQS